MNEKKGQGHAVSEPFRSVGKTIGKRKKKKLEKHPKKFEATRGRTWNLLIRSQAPCPLGHSSLLCEEDHYISDVTYTLAYTDSYITIFQTLFASSAN